MTTTYLSLWLPSLATDRIARRDGGCGPGDGTRGLVTVAKLKGTQRVVAVDRAAGSTVRSGMTLADARALRPDLVVAQADPQAEAATLARIADWCGRFTPLVALDSPDGLVLDIGGAAHLFGGEGALMNSIEAGLKAQGFEGRAAIAATPEAAWALARFATLRIAPDTAGKDFRKLVGGLPLAALRLDPATVQALAQAGLRHVDDLLWRPRAPLAARFGEALFARLDAVMGAVKTPISPRFDPPAFVAEQRFASPIVLRDDVERTILALCGSLCVLLDRQNKGARRIEARLFRVDGVVKRIRVGTSRPLTRAPDMARLFRERIESVGEDGLDTGYGFDVVRLAVHAAETHPVRQEDLVAAVAPDRPPEDLADLVDRLGARLGFRRVTRLMGQDTHIPEFAVSAVPAARGMAAAPRAAARSRSAAEEAAPARPIRLFERPEPIDTVAAVPDGPPLRFRWRRAVHEVRAIEGPERIAPEWWKAGSPDRTRDYFQAEDQDGHRFWLFREGLFTPEATPPKATPPDTPPTEAILPEAVPPARPRWYLHGLFG